VKGSGEKPGHVGVGRQTHPVPVYVLQQECLSGFHLFTKFISVTGLLGVEGTG